MDSEERRKLAIEFVRKHQGCTKEDIVEGLKSHISRVPVFDTLQQLLEDKTLRDESKNRRDHKLYVNTDNPLVLVPDELTRFEKAYLNLLHNSNKRINEKDYSTISKILGIAESDPSKWSLGEIERYREQTEEHIEHSYNVLSLYDEIARNQQLKVDSMVQRIGTQIEHLTYKYEPGIRFVDLRQAKNTYKESQEKFILDPQLYILEVKNKEASYLKELEDYVPFVLLYGAIQIFYLFRDLIFWKTTILWPKAIYDKETLSKVCNLAYTKIADLQLKLFEFISRSRIFRLIDPGKSIIEFKSLQSSINKEHQKYMWRFYMSLEMNQYADPVLESFLMMSKELEKSGYVDPDLKIMREGFDSRFGYDKSAFYHEKYNNWCITIDTTAKQLKDKIDHEHTAAKQLKR